MKLSNPELSRRTDRKGANPAPRELFLAVSGPAQHPMMGADGSRAPDAFLLTCLLIQLVPFREPVPSF